MGGERAGADRRSPAGLGFDTGEDRRTLATAGTANTQITCIMPMSGRVSDVRMLIEGYSSPERVGVKGQSELPSGGHENCPLVARGSAQWRPPAAFGQVCGIKVSLVGWWSGQVDLGDRLAASAFLDVGFVHACGA
jgi:hypothetical protein